MEHKTRCFPFELGSFNSQWRMIMVIFSCRLFIRGLFLSKATAVFPWEKRFFLARGPGENVASIHFVSSLQFFIRPYSFARRLLIFNGTKRWWVRYFVWLFRISYIYMCFARKGILSRISVYSMIFQKNKNKFTENSFFMK